VAGGGDPRHFDDSSGSRMAQRSADQGIESIRGLKRPGDRERSSRCLAGRERVKDQQSAFPTKLGERSRVNSNQ